MSLTVYPELAAGRPIGNALEFDGTPQHVNHGAFWQPGVEYGDFLAEFLIKPTGAGYFCSAGYGGNHCLLIGVAGNSTDGWTLTGNVYNSDTGTTTAFATTEPMRHGVWYYVAVTADGADLTCIYNGVPSAAKAFTTPRKTTVDYESVLFVGGSGHNNYAGRIAGVRIFENATPIAAAGFFLNSTYRPPVERFSMASVNDGTSSGMVAASFVADYRTGSLNDLSNGLSGLKHNGFLASAAVSEVEVGRYYNNNAYNHNAALRPIWVDDEFAFPTAAAAQKTQIPGSRIYDDFSRPDIHLGISATLGCGTSRVGNKTWSNSNYGILNGLMFSTNTSELNVLPDPGYVDKSISWVRPSGAWLGKSGYSAIYRFVFRHADDNNYEYAYIDDFGSCYVFEVVAGVPANLGGFSVGTNWTTITVALAGTGCTVSADGVVKGAATLTANLTGTGVGVLFNHPLLRLAAIAVI